MESEYHSVRGDPKQHLICMMPAFLLTLILLLAAPPVNAEGEPYGDFYFNRADKVRSDFLLNVDRYHLPACSDNVAAKRYQQARPDCDFILRYYPNHPRALVNMAEICIALGGSQCEIDAYFKNAISINPNAAGTYVAIGIAQLRAKQVDAAIKTLRRAVELDPESVNAQYNLGLAYLETKQYDLANEAAQRAYALGAPVSGLRDKLQQSGHWKPIAQPTTSSGPAQSPASPDVGASVKPTPQHN